MELSAASHDLHQWMEFAQSLRLITADEDHEEQLKAPYRKPVSTLESSDC